MSPLRPPPASLPAVRCRRGRIVATLDAPHGGWQTLKLDFTQITGFASLSITGPSQAVWQFHINALILSAGWAHGWQCEPSMWEWWVVLLHHTDSVWYNFGTVIGLMSPMREKCDESNLDSKALISWLFPIRFQSQADATEAKTRRTQYPVLGWQASAGGMGKIGEDIARASPILVQYDCHVILARLDAEERISNVRPISPQRSATRFESWIPGKPTRAASATQTDPEVQGHRSTRRSRPRRCAACPSTEPTR